MMTQQEEIISQLATDFEEYLKEHKDNGMLDLTELDITTQQLDWVLFEAIKRGYVNTKNCFNCMNCKHFTKGVYDYDDTCNMGWDCAVYYGKPIRWEWINESR